MAILRFQPICSSLVKNLTRHFNDYRLYIEKTICKRTRSFHPNLLNRKERATILLLNDKGVRVHVLRQIK
ncbi:hypothetical protein CULT_1640001 [[Clostridium] ultunense Esp]|nr:hypothetical protein CULT_1640001 [[Clostridium] ultunense Esp]